MVLSLNNTNTLQRTLAQQDQIYNKAIRELTTEKTSDRLYLALASEALEAAKKYAKVGILNQKSLAEVQATIAKMEKSLTDAIALEQSAADPETSIEVLRSEIATLVADIISENPELNSATNVPLNTFDGAAGSVIGTGTPVTVGSNALEAMVTSYDTVHTVPGTIATSADIIVANLNDAGITMEVHTNALNNLISNIKDALGVAHTAAKKLERHIAMQEINKDLKNTRAEIAHSVDKTDLQRTITQSHGIVNNIRSLLY